MNYPKIKKAKIKLESYEGKRIIITGSFGKTSTKVLFNQILSNFYNTSKTPKSYNTLLGITSYVNNTNINLYDYLILEYGASQVNDIDKLLKLSMPSVAVITDIGLMHLSTFKSLDNIIEEKMKLALNSHLVILNYDNEYIRNYKLINNPIILSYGINNGDYQAKNIKDKEFDLYYKGIYIEHFSINLEGKHNIYNLLAVLAYCHYLKLDMKVISRIACCLDCEKNRLEIKKIGNRTIIDDSFNSNLKGFKEALTVLSSGNGKRILLTPGIVELDKYKSIVNEELANVIALSCDIVILVGYEETKDLYYKLKDYKLEIFIVKDFFEGYSLYKSISNYYIKTTLLIENDLPDLYKRRMLL
jgi:UDP-N-acetylmuramoyl-tripeptide--D-alanyl-D-alanine ligase